jgi:hypothetical protein
MPQPIIDLLASWGPVLAIVAVFIFFARSNGMRARSPTGRTLIELYELHLEEMKRSTATLERIAQALERRAS